MNTYTNFYTVRLSDKEAQTLEKLAEQWSRSRAQTIRDCLALGRLAAVYFRNAKGKPAGDAVALADLLIFGNDPCAG